MKTLNYNIYNATNTNTDTNDYSKILDNIILNTVIDNNSYLFDIKKKEDESLISKMLDSICKFNFIKPKKDDMTFVEACMILANLGTTTYHNKYGIKLNHTYYLEDGTPIIFYSDEFKIDSEYFDYDDFTSPYFIKTIKPEMKKKISKINITIKL